MNSMTVKKRGRASTVKKSTAGPVPRREAGLIRLPSDAFTLEGFRNWSRSQDFPEQGCITFLGQEILIDMSPERLESHNKVKTELTRVLGNLIVANDLGTLYSDSARIVNEPADLSNEPDASFVSWESRETGRVMVIPCNGESGDFIELQGSPDWVLEIVSPSSETKDNELLRKRYHRAGIAEYWLIDARGDFIQFQILNRRRSGYKAAPNQDGWQTSTVFAEDFRLQRIHDRVGEWQYQLQSRSDN